MPGLVFSLREVGLNKVVVLLKNNKQTYLKAWDGRSQIKEEECTPNEFVRCRKERGGDPDRDMDVDLDRGVLYCLGHECLVKLNLETLEYMDSS